MSLILHSSNSSLLPPINKDRYITHILIHEPSLPSWAPSKSSVVIHPRPRIDALELPVCHVTKLVKLEPVSCIHLVEGMYEVDVVFKDIEALLLLAEVAGCGVVASPPLIEIPEALLRR